MITLTCADCGLAFETDAEWMGREAEPFCSSCRENHECEHGAPLGERCPECMREEFME